MGVFTLNFSNSPLGDFHIGFSFRHAFINIFCAIQAFYNIISESVYSFSVDAGDEETV